MLKHCERETAMNFVIDEKIFTIMLSVCFGVVVARGLDNSSLHREIMTIMKQLVRRRLNLSG